MVSCSFLSFAVMYAVILSTERMSGERTHLKVIIDELQLYTRDIMKLQELE